MDPGVEDDRFLEPRAEAVLQLAEAAEVVGADPGTGLDLEGDYVTVVALKHEVNLVAGFGAEVPGGDWRIRPAGLLEDLPDSEGFEEVAIVGESRGRALRGWLAPPARPDPPRRRQEAWRRRSRARRRSRLATAEAPG